MCVMFSSVRVMFARGWTSWVGTKGTDSLWDILDSGTDVSISPLMPALGELYMLKFYQLSVGSVGSILYSCFF